MRAFDLTVVPTRAFHISFLAALVLGMFVTPADAQDVERDRMASLHAQILPSAPPPAARSAQPLTTGTELLSDGGFESGYYGGSQTMGTSGTTGPWTWTNSPVSLNPIWENYGSVVAHTGSYLVYFNPFGISTSRLYQTITIPSGATATLSFWLWVGTFETTHSTAYDTLTVSIADTSGAPLGSITYSNLDASQTWLKHTLDVSPYAGGTVRLQFDVHEDFDNSTVFLLDDVSLVATTSNAACVEDAHTMCLVNGRYKVTSHWRNQYAGGAADNLSKARLTDNEGAFWIADANTHEYLIRFNMATNNGRAWVAIPTFTDVEFWIAVTDTVNGQYKEYHSTPGNKMLIYDPSFFVYP